MLNIFFGNMPDAIYDTSVYFKNTYKDKWITSQLGRDMIKDIDKSDVISAAAIESPVLGIISPEQLSGGVKALLLISNDKKHIFNASTCGDNCAKWILKISDEYKGKTTINLRHIMDFGKDEFKIKVLNTNKIVRNMTELITEAGEFV